MEYLTIKEPQNYWGIDIEADSLNPTKIHLVCTRNLATEEEISFQEKDVFNDWYTNMVGDNGVLVGHNSISFDIYNLNRLWLCGIPLSRCVDTLVLSYLYNPGLDGGHSLEAWGTRLKYPKGDFSDWGKYSKEMEEYCKNDVRLTLKVYTALRNKMLKQGVSELACKIEHDIRVIIDQQQRNGFFFDLPRGLDFLKHLRTKQTDLAEGVSKLFPPDRLLVKRSPLKRTPTGRPYVQFEKDLSKYEVVVSEDKTSYECYERLPFNLGSPKQRVERLLRLGWEPEAFTKKGFPKVDEDALVKFAESSKQPEVAHLAEWLVLQGRTSMLEGWINHVGDDSRIHGRVFSCGATTRRMTHSAPNTANIPSGAKARYGHECRALWGVPPNQGLVLVGYDAAGLETAGLCHYLNNPRATEILLRPKPHDIHTTNATRLSEALKRDIDRECGAKTSWYAWLYGAYPPKLGSIVKGPPSDGDIVIDTFFRNVPGLKPLIERIQREFFNNFGLLQTVDGGFVRCPSQNAALNYKIQSLGAILMKLAAIILDETATKAGINFKLVGSIHDEGQLECEESRGDELGLLAVSSIEEAGRRLSLNVPVTGDYKIGKSWAETH